MSDAPDPKKFDPARAHVLDAPERERYLPTSELIDLLALRGDETVVDYGAGTGRIALAVAERLNGGGEVIAVDESLEMFQHLAEQLSGNANARAVLIAENEVPLPAGTAQRVLLVNVLHEVRGESALAEIRRLLAPGGFALVVDWERGRDRDGGPPPDEILYSPAEAQAEIAAAGLTPQVVPTVLPFHFVLRAVAPISTGERLP